MALLQRMSVGLKNKAEGNLLLVKKITICLWKKLCSAKMVI